MNSQPPFFFGFFLAQNTFGRGNHLFGFLVRLVQRVKLRVTRGHVGSIQFGTGSIVSLNHFFALRNNRVQYFFSFYLAFSTPNRVVFIRLINRLRQRIFVCKSIERRRIIARIICQFPSFLYVNNRNRIWSRLNLFVSHRHIIRGGTLAGAFHGFPVYNGFYFTVCTAQVKPGFQFTLRIKRGGIFFFKNFAGVLNTVILQAVGAIFFCSTGNGLNKLRVHFYRNYLSVNLVINNSRHIIFFKLLSGRNSQGRFRAVILNFFTQNSQVRKYARGHQLKRIVLAFFTLEYFVVRFFVPGRAPTAALDVATVKVKIDHRHSRQLGVVVAGFTRNSQRLFGNQPADIA